MFFVWWHTLILLRCVTENCKHNPTITEKIKNGKIRKIIFHSLQHSGHLSCKYGHFWGGVGVHTVNWDRAYVTTKLYIESILKILSYTYLILDHTSYWWYNYSLNKFHRLLYVITIIFINIIHKMPPKNCAARGGPPPWIRHWCNQILIPIRIWYGFRWSLKRLETKHR